MTKPWTTRTFGSQTQSLWPSRTSSSISQTTSSSRWRLLLKRITPSSLSMLRQEWRFKEKLAKGINSTNALSALEEGNLVESAKGQGPSVTTIQLLQRWKRFLKKKHSARGRVRAKLEVLKICLQLIRNFNKLSRKNLFQFPKRAGKHAKNATSNFSFQNWKERETIKSAKNVMSAPQIFF